LSKYIDKLVLKKGKKINKKFEFMVGFIGNIDDDNDDDIKFEKE